MSQKLGKRVLAIAAVGALTVAVSPAASGSAPGRGVVPADPVTVDLQNTCGFPGIGTLPVTAGVTARFPAVVPVSEDIQAKDVSVQLGFPAQTVTALREAGVASLAGTASLDLVVRHPDRHAKAQVRAGITEQALPVDGDLTATAPGEVDPIGTIGAGEVVLTVSPPTLVLTVDAVEGTELAVTSPLEIPCVADPEQDTELATVRVTAPENGSTTTPSSPDSGGPQTSLAAPGTSRGTEPSTKAPGTSPRTAGEASSVCGTEVPDDAFKLPGQPFYDVVVTAGIKKLNTETVFGPPAYVGAEAWYWVVRDPEHGFVPCSGIEGNLWLPPTPDEFVIFRFVPTSAVVEVTQAEPIKGILDGSDFIFRGSAKVNMRARDVKINGTPLDVGPSCGTQFAIEFKSKPGEWNLADGGVIEAEYTIPEFSNCGVDEPIESLFTNLISGPENHMKMEFGKLKLCGEQPVPPPVCKPEEADR